MTTKSAVAIVKSVRQLSCVSQDIEPPESAAISRKGTKVLGPIRRVRFTKAALRQANIPENKGPSLGKIQVKIPHQRSPHAKKFEDRSPGETERQERCARGDALNLAKQIHKLKEKEKATLHSPSEECVMPAASTMKSEEREFVVDTGASMHMLSRKNQNSAELETVRISKSPTTVLTANGEVQTREEATVYVKEMDLFVTGTLLEETPAVLSLAKLCEVTGIYTIGPVVRNHISSKLAGTSISTQRTMCHSLSLVCRQILLLHHHLLLLHLQSQDSDHHGTSSNRKK